MKKILIFGAGKSSTCLIDYLVKTINEKQWSLVLCDSNLKLAEAKSGGSERTQAVSANVENDESRRQMVSSCDLVISMLPAHLHFLVAKDCLELKKNLLTASYIDDNIRSLGNDVSKYGLLFLCEIGLDPGIDHMSAMKIIHSIQKKGGVIKSFKSHCGGLVAPESDSNPWHYKITWNSRNVVLAGSDGAEYLQNDKVVNVPYASVFKHPVQLTIPGLYPLCWYPNRNSLNYIRLYELDHIPTFIRTTLRHPAFCHGWHKLISMGLTQTNDYDTIKDCKTLKEWMNVKTARYTLENKDWNNYLHLYITDPFKDEFTKQMHFLKLLSNDPLPSGFLCSADILQAIVEEKLKLVDADKDMVVLLHEIDFILADTLQSVTSKLVVKGDDNERTAMAKTVGLPLGIAAKLILENKIKLTGLHIPILREIYDPLLAELEQNGILFETEGLDLKT